MSTSAFHDVSEGIHKNNFDAFQEFAERVRRARPTALSLMGGGMCDDGALTDALDYVSRSKQPKESIIGRFEGKGEKLDAHELVIALCDHSETGFYLGVALGLMLRPEMFAKAGAR